MHPSLHLPSPRPRGDGMRGEGTRAYISSLCRLIRQANREIDKAQTDTPSTEVEFDKALADVAKAREMHRLELAALRAQLDGASA